VDLHITAGRELHPALKISLIQLILIIFHPALPVNEGKCIPACLLVLEIEPYQFLEQFIPLKFPYQASCIVVARNVGRVSGHDITDDLAYRVISFLLQGLLYIHHDLTGPVGLFFIDIKFHRPGIHMFHPLPFLQKEAFP